MKLTIRCTSGLRIRFEGSSAELEHFDAFLSYVIYVIQCGESPCPDHERTAA